MMFASPDAKGYFYKVWHLINFEMDERNLRKENVVVAFNFRCVINKNLILLQFYDSNSCKCLDNYVLCVSPF